MGQYLIDNNVISNYFSELFSEKTMIFISKIIDETPNISVITEIEALSWINPDKKKEGFLKEFVFDSNILMLNPEIVTECIKIRRSKKIRTPDAIIATTAIVHNLTLITNDNDFNGIQKLKTINPFSL
jgi:predicted nucleic acid-binding protein